MTDEETTPIEPAPAPGIDAEEVEDTDDEQPSSLGGTDSELAPGTGAGGEHPAPAAMRDEEGELHVAGEPAGTYRSDAPEGDPFDLQSGGDVTDPEALAKLNAEHEPEQVETERPDIGTE